MVTAIQMIILGNGAMNVSNEFAIDVMFDVDFLASLGDGDGVCV